MIEELTKDERDTVRTTSDVSGPKALRIIDALTEALADVESAERIRTEQRNESDAECVRLTEALAASELRAGGLAHQPAPEPARCSDCGGVLAVITNGFGEAFACPRCDQPVAPTRCDQAQTITAEQAAHIMSGAPLPRFEVQDALARTEAEPSLWCDNCEEPMDREGDNPAGVCDVCWNSYQADKAVLDAMARVTVYSLRDEIASGNYFELSEACRAELARRGLK